MAVHLHSSRGEALTAAAEFAYEVLGRSDLAVQLFRDGRFEELLQLYERTHFHDDALLRVEWGAPVGDLSDVDGLGRVLEPSDPDYFF